MKQISVLVSPRKRKYVFKIKIYLLAEKTTENIFTFGNKIKICLFAETKTEKMLLPETKSKILLCLEKQTILFFSLALENKYRYIFTCANKVKDFLSLKKTKYLSFAWDNNL